MSIQEMIEKLEHFKMVYGPDVKVGKRSIYVEDGSIRYADIKNIRANYIDVNDPTTLIVNF